MKRIIPLLILLFFVSTGVKSQDFNSPENKKLGLSLAGTNIDAIGISTEEMSAAIVSSSFEDPSTGIQYVYLQQGYKGIPVYNQMLVLAFKNGKLISKAGFFDPSIEKLINVSSAVPAINAESAVQSALSDRGLHATQMAVAINRKDNGRFVEFGNMGVSQQNITAQLSWVPNEKTKIYELAWQVYIIPKTTSDYWMVRVNAMNNSILGMDNYTSYDNWGTPDLTSNYPAFLTGQLKGGEGLNNNEFDYKANNEKVSEYNGPTLADNGTYRVIPIPYEAPSFMPGASTTWHAIRNNPWVDATVANATTLKWHTGASSTDYNYTRGNNVWAYHDRNNNNSGDPSRSATSTTALPNLTFDFTPDYTLEPTVTSPAPNQQFNITNLFYWNNLIHDIFYGYGFTEVGGNFQDDNLGRGGIGNDHVNAEAQDGSGSNNANFSTPVDGGSGRMQMYLWTAPTPDRDGDVDNGIIIHEHGHGISIRITGGPGNSSCLNNQEQGGEGWSDYFALMLTQDWSTATVNTGFNSPRGVGTYALNEPPTGVGIRPTRYGTNFADNPSTYASLPGQVAPHGVGYVWCTMLWEMTWELINEIGTIDPNIYNWNGTGGNVRALRLVMEGLRLQPCSPGFVDARNAILRADTTLFGGIYYCPIMRAFARRGLGVNANQGSSNNKNDGTPDFTGGGPVMTFTQSGAAGVPELQNIVYTHTVTAACTALTNYSLKDTLPTNVNFVSATNGGTYDAGTRVVNWPVNLANGATGNYGLTVQIAAGSYFPPVVLINETVPTTTIDPFWTTASTTANVWIAHNTRSHSAPNSFFTPNAGLVSDQTIATTNSFAIGATPPELNFWHWINSENNFDGGVLEISTNGGTTWSDIGESNFIQNGYTATISSSFGNPLAGRRAWSGNGGSFKETKVNLAPYANQATVKLRWRFGSDNSVSSTGWNLDDISAQTIAVVNLRSSLFNAANVRVDYRDTVTVILPPNATPPTVTINQAAAQPDPTTVSPINFTVVFDQAVTGFATGDVTLSGTAGATTAIVSGSGATYNVAVSGMTSSGTVMATIPANVCTNTNGDQNQASTSTDNTVTFTLLPPPTGCITTVSYTGPAVAIPDATAAGVNIPLTVSGVGTIADLNFKLVPTAGGTCNNTAGNLFSSVDHTWNGDLIFRLTSPSATTVTLINRRGSGGNNFCAVTLDDDGGYPATSTMPITGGINGNFAPENPLSAFDGQNANGVWTLNVSDNAGGDLGNVRGFALEFTTALPTVNPVPNDTVCNNSAAGPYTFTSPSAGATFSWTNSDPSIGLAASGSGNIAAFTATNATTAPVTATVTVTPVVNNIINITGSLAAGDGTITGGRINRNAVASTCATPKVFPGTLGSGPYFYDSYTYTNTTGAAQCVSVTYTRTGASGQVHVTAYAGSYNPTNQATNYLADGGNSSAGAPVTFSFNVANGATIVFVAFEPNINEACPGYSLAITGMTPGCPGNPSTFNITVNPTPTVNAVPNQTVCKGSLTAPVNFSGSIAGTVYNWTNSAPTIGLAASGTGNIPAFIADNPTNGPLVATITVTPVYTINNYTCSGTPVSFTITVNENLPLVVTAVPGTTLCEGDPALLTVYNATGLASVALTQSTSTTIVTNNSVSCNAGGLHTDNSYWRAYNLAPLALPSALTVTNVSFGIEQASGGGQPVTVRLYTQTTGTFPGGTRTLVGTQGATVPDQNGTIFTVNFLTPVVVPNTAVLIVELFTPSGQATGKSFFIGSNTAPQTGPSYLSAAACGVTTPTDVAAIGFPNMHIILNAGGTVLGAGGIATGTFLWSPAAGLSSTTGNPVAASPMVTTTYKVVRTTAAGCKDSANITLTINQRPRVTANPVSTTNCSGTTATFTVAGVGTALSYQWQVSTAGVGGPWVNVTNAAPYSGATTATLTVNPVTVAMSGYAYRCVLGGTCPPGIPPLNVSGAAVLTVNPLPVVTVTPTSGCGGVKGINGLELTASGADTYTWAPITGLYLDAQATVPYTGGDAATVYAAPAALTVYTVTGTLNGTGCFNSATALVNYTPPAPTVTPASVTMCLGDNAVMLTSSSSSTSKVSFNSGTISVAIPEGVFPTAPATAGASTIPVSGIPAGATISRVDVKLNITHAYVGDVVAVLKAPNGQIFNLDALLSATNNPGINFVNTVISSAGTAALSTGSAPFTSTFKADAVGATFIAFGFTLSGGPVGYIPTTQSWNDLYSTPNGNWTVAMYDAGAPDQGTLTNWSIDITYVEGVPSTAATWSPIAGLYNDANATIAYTGTPQDTVWTKPTPSGVYNYYATVQSLPASGHVENPAPITINASGPATPYPSVITVNGLPTTGVGVKNVILTGVNHTWAQDVDVLLQSPSGQNVILMSDVGGFVAIPNATYTFDDAGPAMNATAANPTGTYHPTNNGATDNFPAPGPGSITQASPAIAMFGNTANVNGNWKLFVFDDIGGDQGNITGGFAINFDVNVAACTSPARKVVVTVNEPTTVATQPVNQTICTDKVATFTVVAAGSGPFSYQWQESTDIGNNWTDINDGGVYSGANTATLTLTAPPVTMSGNFYRVVITGAAPCAPVTSFQVVLTVNPLPVVIIAANPTRLVPGLTTTITSTVTPFAVANGGYMWTRNGAQVGGSTPTLLVDVDGLGDYQLTVTDINGCTNSSNVLSILDSASGKCYIYPNPTSGQFQVRYYSVANNVLPRSLTVYDAKGDRVLTQMYNIGRPYDKMEVDMRKYGKGLYWVEIGDRNGSRITMCRVVIQ